MHIADSINVPRGILETACEYDFEETIPELVEARDKTIIIVCRSGNRSLFAADVMQQMGYKDVISLKTGLRGWNEADQPLVTNNDETVDVDAADEYFSPKLKPEQLKPQS
jgi:rhodanese-related sulfurtransferase